ncbi:MAG TPA: heparinase II/III family protein [Planctomycetota bacterium]|nr:heparinase II/III family protein [Planctomycetota bacterium]
MPRITLPSPMKHPCLACTPEELGRLQAAWKGRGAAHDVVAALVARADKVAGKAIVFPPRGGQHNQWYQCDACQMALKTVDEAHHRCPKCGKVYTGEPYDDVIFERQHYVILKGMIDCAWAGAITGERRYSEHAAAVLKGYSERYAKYPYHTNNWKDARSKSGGHIFEQTLNEAAQFSLEIGPAFDLVLGSRVLSDAEAKAVRDGLVRPMIENIARNQSGKSNWQSWHNAAMVWGGALLGEAAWVERAVSDPANGFDFQMKASVSADGMWYENSWGYHFYTLSALVATAEPARRLGLDLWKRPEFRKMFTLSARYAMPDGSLPRFGDDVNTKAAGDGRLLECAWNATREPALAALLPDKPSWESVLFGREPEAAPRRPAPGGSEVFRGAGHAVLRTKGEAGLAAAFTFGPYGGFHGHLDKLSFVFFGYGKELGVDPGRAASQAYRLPVHGNWYKATVGHNAVLVDGLSQEPVEGKCELFAANDSCAAALASCDAAYKGVRHRRLLVIMPSYLLVLDELAAGSERRFDWTYHNRGSAARCEAAAGEVPADWKMVGREYLKGARGGRTDGAVRVEFAGDEVSTWLAVAAAAGTQVVTADGVGASVEDRVPLAIVSRTGRSARFAAVLEPVRKGGRPVVESVAIEEGADGLVIKVRQGGVEDLFSLGRDGGMRVSTGGREVLSAPKP